MDGIYLLAALSAAMFFGSYIAGSIPLAFTLSESRVRLLSIFGAGLLVGTALSVIIPEGVESLYESQAELHNAMFHHAEARSILEKNAALPENPPRIIPQNAQLNENLKNDGIMKKREKRDEEGGFASRKLLQIVPLQGASAAGEHALEETHLHGTKEIKEAAHLNVIHKSIGFSLIIGFIFMLIIDQATRSASSKGGERSRFTSTATIGLVVHAAADGIALGSASATNRTAVQFIVFLAIMLHKAPAAFGLVSFLLVEGLERSRIRRHLLVFSLAAPVTALLTFYAIIAVGSESLSSGSSTGVLMLFSAGTFLYVATVHVLPELVNAADEYRLVSATNGVTGHSHSGSGPAFTMKELAAIIFGAIAPAVLASGHSHSH